MAKSYELSAAEWVQTNERVRLEALRTCEDLLSIRSDWMRLANTLERRGFYHLPDWYQSYLESGDEACASFVLIALYKGDKLVAVLPLQESLRKVAGLPVRVLEFPKTESRLHDVLIAPAVTLEFVLGVLRTRLRRDCGVAWDVLRLNAVPGGTGLSRLTSGLGTWLTLQCSRGYCNYIDLSDEQDYFAGLSRKHRQTLRRRRRRLDEHGHVSFHTVDKSPLLETAFDEFLDVEGSGWKHQRGGKRAVQLNPTRKAFFTRVMQHFGASENCHIHLLRLGGKSIAASFNIIVDDTCYGLKIGYDESYAKMSPGNLLAEYIINFYSGDPRVKFINLISGSPWLRDWRPSKLVVYDFYVFNHSGVGILAYLSTRASWAAQAAQTVKTSRSAAAMKR